MHALSINIFKSKSKAKQTIKNPLLAELCSETFGLLRSVWGKSFECEVRRKWESYLSK